MKNTIFVLFVISVFFGCKPKAESQSSHSETPIAMDEGTLKKIDIHVHFKYSREYLPALFKKWNMQGVLVDVYREDPNGIVRSWDNYLTHAQTYPKMFSLCSAIIGVGIDEPDYAKKTIEQLSQEIDSGARMVKVWKNFGMVTKDASGKYIQIDDPRLQPIWDFLKSKQIPVLAHIAEPLQAWRKLDPKSPHYGYYMGHPQYHAYNFPEIPSYETIISARDNWIQKNPNLKILGAHMGSMSHNVDMVAERLDKFPNMYVETAARFGDLASQDSDEVKAFLTKYQDRVFFGTDYGNSIPQSSIENAQLKEEQRLLDTNYRLLWNYLSGTDSLEIRGQKTRGLGLPIDILKKVYYQNAVNFLKLK
ncbi:amidohydrolase family protein [Ulvibacterium sp.]|uniref:amidohydrolase family protein n=1 Tax=Ulvibacterium sp. TaxID=2665914 RepID=UPI00260C896D|nr:amidohydrolase family protein [Ulvibacterium sp.]